MRILSLPVLLKFIALVSIVTLVGCESADVDPEHIAAAGSGGSPDSPSDGTPPGPGGETIKTIKVDPATGTHQSMGDYTILKVSPISGYTFTWTISDPSLGNIGTKPSEETVYTTTSIPSDPKVQIITVTGRNPNSSIVYRGTSKITHSAP